jgi:hypothetical protein
MFCCIANHHATNPNLPLLGITKSLLLIKDNKLVKHEYCCSTNHHTTNPSLPYILL